MTGRFPRRFGKYVLLKPLAKGGMGEIYLAVGGQIGGFEKLCVIKKVITEKTDKSKANRFLDEAKVVLRLSHSALVSTFDAGEVEGEFYIAMELVEGKDLREVWNRCVRVRQRIPLDVALYLVREVARALAYVHAYGDLRLVHRDVAPPNILLAYVGDVKLTDFGLARSVLKQEHTAPGVVFGRAAYLAPEQARGEVADARTDVYSLGIVLWELLTGQQYLQLSGLDPAAALALVRHPKVVPPSSRAAWITPALDHVVQRALAPERPDRFQTADEMRQALGEVIADVAPRADAARVADFLRAIYTETIEEERVERERFLSELVPKFRRRSELGQEELSPISALAAELQRQVPASCSSGPVPGINTGPGAMAPPSRSPEKPSAQGGIVHSGPAGRSRRPSGPLPLPGLPPSVAGRASTSGTSSEGMLVSSGAVVSTPGVASPVPAVRATPPGRGSIVGQGDAGDRVVGACRLGRAVVTGRAGTLYQAERVDGGEAVSVRVLNDVAGLDSDRLSRAHAVVDQIASLGSPNIPVAFEVGVTQDGRLYAVLEPLNGMDLASLIARERRLDAGRAVHIARQVSRALCVAAERGLVHGDVRPERILAMPQGAMPDLVKVLDLGLIRRPPTASANRPPPAAAAYCAPERFQGGAPDARTEVYAVAAILYEMVTGAPPYAGAADASRRKLVEAPQSPRLFRPDIPIELERVLMTALDPAADKRFATLSALENALCGITWGHPVAAPAASPSRASTATALASADRRRSRRDAAFLAISQLAATEDSSPASPAMSSSMAELIESTPPRPRVHSPNLRHGNAGGAMVGAPVGEIVPVNPAASRAFGTAVLDRHQKPATSRRVWTIFALVALAAATLAAMC